MDSIIARPHGAPSGSTSLPPDSWPLTPTEEFVAWLWQRQIGGGTWLRPDGCPPLRVVYPGARRAGRGPDFQGALLATRGGQLLSGDVEIHLRTSDWRAHGHQRDAAYNRAVLHVVWHPDGATLARRADGALMPQLVLSACLPRPLNELLAAYRSAVSQPPPPVPRSPAEVAAGLEAAGLARFGAKAAACEADIVALGPEQALYRRLAAALGYSVNQRPFLRLADLVSVAELRGWVAEAGPERAAQRLLDWAGLGPGRVAGGLSGAEWVLGGVRPGNLPQRRVRALCHLAARYAPNLSAPLAQSVRAAWSARRPGHLVQALRLSAETRGGGDMRRRGIEPARGASGSPPRTEPALIGEARAREMVVNALLPWALAWGEASGSLDMRAAAVGCYRAFPRCADNSITREAASLLGLSPRVARTACQQQGLLHVYRQHLHDAACWHLGADGRWRWEPLGRFPIEARRFEVEASA